MTHADVPRPAGDRPGATVVAGGVRFEVWAPEAARLDVVIGPDGDRRVVPMAPIPPAPDGADAGRWETTVDGIGAGARYRIRIDAGDELADPASRHQPEGVFGPSAVVDPSTWAWSDADWRGVSLRDTVLYEVHVGTFTEGGTLDAAIAELPRLAELGITTIELMPLSQFSGERGWGYDGVFLNAVQHSYGGPTALARFVDAAHAVGLAVIVDAVYNHFGPEGNVLSRFGPYTTDTYATPWGGAVNLSEAGSDEVRRLFLDNARMWIDDYHLDGLRLDAVHAIVDPTALPFLEQLNDTVHEIGRRRGRTVLTFLESAANDPRMVTPPPYGVGGDAVWNDELHHAVRVALTGDRSGYYADYHGAHEVADVLEHRITYRGRYSGVRGRRHGRDVSHVAPERFVVFDQNHDQIGNRRDGERLGVLVGPDRRRLALAAVLLSPFTPMLFMGEDYGDPAPFPFFVDFHDPSLLDAVRDGRAREFADFEWETDPPDPAAVETFRSAVLSPELLDEAHHAGLAGLSGALLAARRAHPALTDAAADVRFAVTPHDRGRGDDTASDVAGGALLTMRRCVDGDDVLVVMNFTDSAMPATLDGLAPKIDTADPAWGGPGRAALDGGTARLPAWSALFASADGT